MSPNRVLLREAFRVLRPGGRIKLVTPDVQALAELYVAGRPRRPGAHGPRERERLRGSPPRRPAEDRLPGGWARRRLPLGPRRAGRRAHGSRVRRRGPLRGVEARRPFPRGSDRTIASPRPIILYEPTARTATEAWELLRDHGYDAHRVHGQIRIPVDRPAAGSANMLALPGESGAVRRGIRSVSRPLLVSIIAAGEVVAVAASGVAVQRRRTRGPCALSVVGRRARSGGGPQSFGHGRTSWTSRWP